MARHCRWCSSSKKQSACARQTRTLIWRNIRLLRRNYVGLILVFLLPLVYIIIIVCLSNVIPLGKTFSVEPASQPVPVPLDMELRAKFLPFPMVIAYTPDNSEVVSRIAHTLVDSATCNLCTFVNATLLPLRNNTAVESYILKQSGFLHAVMEFTNVNMDGSLPQNGNSIDITIRFNSSAVPPTNDNAVLPTSCRVNMSCPIMQYVTSGLLDLESELAHALARELLGIPGLRVHGTTRVFPRPSYTEPPTFLLTMGPIFVCLSFWPFVAMIINNVVIEKEKKLKDGMNVMGLAELAYFLSWLVTFAIIGFVLTLAMTLVLVLGGLLENSSVFLVWLLLYLYALSCIGYSLCVTPFFTHANAATPAGTLFATMLGVLYIPLTLAGPPSTAAMYACSLLSPVALTLGVGQGIFLEISGTGLQFPNIWESVNGYSFGSSLIILMLDVGVYFFLAWYLDAVIPSEYGPKRKPWFFLSPSYWHPPSPLAPHAVRTLDAESGVLGLDLNDVEKLPLNANIAVSIRGLSKLYPRPDRLTGSRETLALDDLSLDMVEGQIFGILGHNGAGKSTLLSILSGSVSSSSGSAEIYGKSITTDIYEIRSTLGFCPQHNLLFEYLTVREHLVVFAGIKGGIDPDGVHDAVNDMLQELELTEVSSQMATTLSGGQKRKLSVAVALIGSPRIIILDEPTAGMDVYVRRKMWDILQRNKLDKVIIVASHFLDEIDIVADRKAILTHGRVRCCGTSMFLKSRFGLGYYLTFDFGDGPKEMTTDANDRILSLVRQFVPDATAEGLTGMDLSYRLPLTYAKAFPNLFHELDAQRSALGILSFAVSMTTLEDVFLRLEHDAADFVNEAVKDTVPAAAFSSITPGDASRTQQFRALTYVKFRQIARRPLMYVSIVGMALVQQLIGLIIGNLVETGSGASANPPLLLGARLVPTTASTQPLALPVYFENASSIWNAHLANSFPFPWYQVENLTELAWIDSLVNSSAAAALRLKDANNATNVSVTILVNPTNLHALPRYWGIAVGAAFSALGSLLGQDPPPSFNITMQPLPSVQIPFSGGSLGTVLLLSISLSILPIALALEVVRERHRGIRHQLEVLGLDPHVYWLSCLARDLSVYSVLGLSTVILILAFQIPCLIGPAMFPIVLCLLVFLPTSVIFAYLSTFLFSSPDTFMSISAVFAVLAVVPLVLVATITQLGNASLASMLHYILLAIDPPYGFAGTLFYICEVKIAADHQHQPVVLSDYFDFGAVVPGSLLMILAQLFLGSGVIVAIETRKQHIHGRLKERMDKTDPTFSLRTFRSDGDIDVMNERNRLHDICDDVLIACGLHKEFHARGRGVNLKSPSRETTGPPAKMDCRSLPRRQKNVAVDDLWFGVRRGECFGLLGPNGAGKTTTLAMLTGEVAPSRGQAILAGKNTHQTLRDTFRELGYCPQFDALFDDLTCREHLMLISKIKGIPEDLIEIRVNEILSGLGLLHEHADKVARDLSGGTRRKLSFCLAIIANPAIVILDEPSSGMDPFSRRSMWQIIRTNVDGRACLLTTHSMEEADALCNRIGVMVKGKLRAIGTSHHLKTKYGDSYRLEIQIAAGRRDALKAFLNTMFPAHEMVQEDDSHFVYHVPKTSVTVLGNVFAALQIQKDLRVIEEYAFSQASLAQVFSLIVNRNEEDSKVQE